jgi:3-oxoacyl-[acyl-carrier protein] reductase
MSLDFSGKVAIVTGSSAGIGAAAARGLAQGGASVVINYSNSQDAADKVVAECKALGGDAIAVKADLSISTNCAELVKAAIEKWGRLDILVNNAGTTKFVDHADLDSLDPEDFKKIYALNVIAPFEMIKAARPHLAANGDGSIVNISSVAGVRAVGSSLAYIASKGGLNSMTMGLARALGAEGIRVNAVCPGFVGTDWFRNVFGEDGYNKIVDAQTAVTPLNRVAGPEEIQGPILFFANSLSRHVTGQLLVVDGGMLLGMPTAGSKSLSGSGIDQA